MNKFRNSLVAGIVFISLTIPARASETKSMSLAGGANAIAQVSLFIHNALPVTVRFKLHRDGSDNDFGQRLVGYKLISPNSSEFSAQRSIGGAVETFEANMPAAGGGNAVREWKVELKNLETPSNAEVNKVVSGTVEFLTTGSTTETISVSKFDLGKQEAITKTLKMPFTGNLKIQANWDTDEISLEAYQIALWFRKEGDNQYYTDKGYSRDSVILGVSSPHRLKLEVKLKASMFLPTAGEWKLRIEGSSKGKIKNVDLKISVSDGIYQ
jgi:hypothetical protein